ncbi:hypothetical protein L873DRAFT_1825792 [Choiromyces venosus 120613-1]|uniref:Rhodopsin domain-containing protein n=1 Tax=Choiromyces venosus 120613-1 TaxID=1336337 RepID=A0A3N4K4E8_9PEZI|nr:hypothetical protein L873DRAFT_1825792 [Choiromyces venosus 120613-1]
MGVIPRLVEPTNVHDNAAWTPSDNFYRVFAPADFTHPAILDPGYIPDTRNSLLRGFALVPLVIATVTVGLRIYSRLRILKKLEWDDWAIIPVLMAYTAYTGLIIWGIESAGLAGHLYNLNTGQIFNWFKVQYLLVIVAPITFLLIRFSILLFLHRLAGNGEPGTQITVKVLHVLNFLWYPASVLPPVLMCAPREMRMWDLMAIIRAQCFNPKVADSMQINSTSMVVLSASFDIACLLVPVRLVWKLRMSTRRKVVISSLFGVGILACVCGILRAYFMAKLLEKHVTSFDTTWNLVNPLICAQMEACLGIITACGPSLKMLYKQLYATSEPPIGKQPTTGMSSLTGAKRWSNRSVPGVEFASLDETAMSGPPP